MVEGTVFSVDKEIEQHIIQKEVDGLVAARVSKLPGRTLILCLKMNNQFIRKTLCLAKDITTSVGRVKSVFLYFDINKEMSSLV